MLKNIQKYEEKQNLVTSDCHTNSYRLHAKEVHLRWRYFDAVAEVFADLMVELMSTKLDSKAVV